MVATTEVNTLLQRQSHQENPPKPLLCKSRRYQPVKGKIVEPKQWPLNIKSNAARSPAPPPENLVQNAQRLVEMPFPASTDRSGIIHPTRSEGAAPEIRNLCMHGPNHTVKVVGMVHRYVLFLLVPPLFTCPDYCRCRPRYPKD